MPPSEVKKIFRAFAEERKRELLQFTPDGIPITPENKFDDAIYNYLYAYWKEHSGEYDPKKDVIPESEMNKMHPKTKNEFQFEKWLFEQYGMTSKEKTENTLMGNLNVLLEVSDVVDIAALPVGAIAVGAKLVGKKVIKEVGEKAVKEVAEEVVEKTIKKETAEEVAENTAKKEIADTSVGFREHMTLEEIARYDEYWMNVAERISNEALDSQIIYIKNGGIKKTGGGKYQPVKISATVDLNTGDIYFGYNGANKFNPSRIEIDPKLQQRIDYTKELASNTEGNIFANKSSFEIWSVENCAEIYSANNALHNGASLDNIFINTKKFKDSTYAPPCKNCQITFEGVNMPQGG